MVADTEGDILEGGSNQNPGSKSGYQRISLNTNAKIAGYGAGELGYRKILAERDEMIGYVKALKSMAIYLTGRTNIRREDLSNEYFEKAELNFPEYIRKEIRINLGE